MEFQTLSRLLTCLSEAMPAIATLPTSAQQKLQNAGNFASSIEHLAVSP